MSKVLWAPYGTEERYAVVPGGLRVVTGSATVSATLISRNRAAMQGGHDPPRTGDVTEEHGTIGGVPRSIAGVHRPMWGVTLYDRVLWVGYAVCGTDLEDCATRRGVLRISGLQIAHLRPASLPAYARATQCP
eukprot:779838-Rhodomonas_salina.2